MNVRVQMEDFDVSREIAAVRAGNPRIGTVASFVGVVRDLNDGSSVAEMTLEHYPGMTEKSIEAIINEARNGRMFILVDDDDREKEPLLRLHACRLSSPGAALPQSGRRAILPRDLPGDCRSGGGKCEAPC